MNVMAQAHKMTKAEIRHQGEVDPMGQHEWMTYPQILKIMLRRAHREFKDMQAQDYFKAQTVGRNTHEMQVGDIVVHYNAVFKLTSRTDWPREVNESDMQGHCVTFTTELLQWREGTMPKHWAEGWVFQGNKLAHWTVVAK